MNSHWYMVGGFTALTIVGTIVIQGSMSGSQAPPVSAVMLALMVGAQALFLLLLAPSAVLKAVQRDFQTGMDESLRLTPMSDLRIALGYLLGAPIRLYLLYGAATVFGLAFAASYGAANGANWAGVQVVAGGFLLAQVCLIALSLLAMIFVALIGLRSKGKSSSLGGIVVIAMLLGWPATLAVPALGLLTGILTARALFELITNQSFGGDPLTVVHSTGFQLFFFGTLVAAFCRSFRRPDEPPFNILLGILLAVGTAGCLLAARSVTESFAFLLDGDDWGFTRLVAGTLAFALAVLPVLIAAAFASARSDRQAALTKGKLERPSLGAALVPAFVGVLGALTWKGILALTPASQMDPDLLNRLTTYGSWLAVLLSMLLYAWTLFNWLYLLCVRGWRLQLGLWAFVIVFHGLPVLAAISLEVAQEAAETTIQYIPHLAAVSPVGTLMYLDHTAAVVFGLVAQLVLAGIVTIAAQVLRRGVPASLQRPEPAHLVGTDDPHTLTASTD